MNIEFTPFSSTTFGLPPVLVPGGTGAFTLWPVWGAPTTFNQSLLVIRGGAPGGYPVLIPTLEAGTTFFDFVHVETIGTPVVLDIINNDTEFYNIKVETTHEIDSFSNTVFYDYLIVGEHFVLDTLPTNTTISPVHSDYGVYLDLGYPGATFTPASFLPKITFDQILLDPNEPDEKSLSVFDTWEIESGGNYWIQPPNLTPTTVFYTMVFRGDRIHPLRFKRAESPLGGDITLDNLAPMLDYIPVSPVDYTQPGNFIQSRVTGLINNYIPPTEALFSRVVYRGFYIRNDSLHDTMTNIDFWINGGEYYTVNNQTTTVNVPESKFIIESEQANHGYVFSQLDKDLYLYGGRGRTSLFDQLQVSYLVRPSLYPFNEQGIGVGVNLPREVFTPGNMATRLPDLGVGEYVGVYIKIEMKFSPDFPIQQDYAFLHLRYSNLSTGVRDVYPGQVTEGDGNQTGILLPSVYIQLGTDYSKLNKSLTEEVDRFYDKYPPYFSYYQE